MREDGDLLHYQTFVQWAVVDGKQVYAGPLADRDGKERVKAGENLSDADLWAMDWFVKGVESAS